MIRVAYILTSVEFGGAEKVSLTFLKNVDRSRFDICPILLVRPWEEENILVGRLREANYDIYKIPVAIKPQSEGRDYFRILRCLRDLRSIVNKNSFDLIHTHGYFADIIGTPTAKILRLPHLSTCHGFISNDRNLKLCNMLDCFSLRFCDRIIAVSEGIRDDLTRNGINKSKIVVIQNAVESLFSSDNFTENRLTKREQLQVEENEYVAGYVGRLSHEKGLQYLIEAGSILKGKGAQFRMLIIGDGPKRKELENLTVTKGLEREIMFVGFQNDVENWLPALDGFVLPSLTEGTPMALLEAMTIGLPVIASDVGGIPEIVENGVSGFLIPPADSAALAEKLSTLCRNASVRDMLGQAAINATKSHCNVLGWSRQIEKEYELLIAKS